MKKEQDTLQESASETHNGNSESELFEQRPIEKTPFTAVKMDDKWFLTMGKYRLTEPLQTFQQCEAEAQDASWFRIMQIIKIMIEEDKKETLKKQ